MDGIHRAFTGLLVLAMSAAAILASLGIAAASAADKRHLYAAAFGVFVFAAGIWFVLYVATPFGEAVEKRIRERRPSKGFTVVRATWGMADAYDDVTDLLTMYVNNGRLELVADVNALDDPGSGISSVPVAKSTIARALEFTSVGSFAFFAIRSGPPL